MSWSSIECCYLPHNVQLYIPKGMLSSIGLVMVSDDPKHQGSWGETCQQIEQCKNQLKHGTLSTQGRQHSILSLVLATSIVW